MNLLDLLFQSLLQESIHFIGDKLSHQLMRNEKVMHLKKSILGSLPKANDFESLYTSAVIEYSVDKPTIVLELFRNNDVKNIFSKARSNNFLNLKKDIDNFLHWNKIGDEINNSNINISDELEKFRQVFIDVINSSRNLADSLDHIAIQNIEQNQLYQKLPIKWEQVRKISNGLLGQNPNDLATNINKNFLQDIPLQKPKSTIETIYRKNLVEEAFEAFKSNNTILLYGYPKIGKSILASQIIERHCYDRYYYYCVPCNESEDRLSVINLLKFINQFTDIQNTIIDYFNNKIGINDIVTTLKNIIPKVIFCFDDIENLRKESTLNELIQFLIESGGEHHVILISNSKKIYFKQFYSEVRVKGFSLDEIKEYLKINELFLNILNDKLLELLQIRLDGHPLLILAHIKFISSLKDTEIFTYLTGLKPIKKVETVKESIGSDIYTNLLNEEEQLLFNRVCTLFYGINEQIVIEISKIEPKIKNPLFIWNNLKKFILESKNDKDYYVPSIYQAIGLKYSRHEQNEIYSCVGNFLLQDIKDKRIDILKTIHAINYLFLGRNFVESFWWAATVLHLTLDNNKSEYLDFILFQLLILESFELININFDKDEHIVNIYFGFLIKLIEAYDALKNYQKIEQLLDKLDVIIKKSKHNQKFSLIKTFVSMRIYMSYEQNEKATQCIEQLSAQMETFDIPLAEIPDISEMDILFPLSINMLSKTINIQRVIPVCQKGINVYGCEIFNDKKYQEIFQKTYDGYVIKNKHNSHLIDELSDHLEFFQNHNLLPGIIAILGSMALFHHEVTKNVRKALEYIGEAENYDLKQHYRYLAFTNYVLKGDIQFFSNMFLDAFKSYQTAVRYWDVDYDPYYLGHCFFKIGIINAKNKKWNDATRAFFKAFRVFHKNQLHRYAQDSLGEMAICFILKEEYFKAVRCFEIIINRYFKLQKSECNGNFTLTCNLLSGLQCKIKGDEPITFTNTEKSEVLFSAEIGLYARFLEEDFLKKEAIEFVHYQLGISFFEFGKHKKAIKYFRLCNSKKFNLPWITKLLIAISFIKMSKIKEAIKAGIEGIVCLHNVKQENKKDIFFYQVFYPILTYCLSNPSESENCLDYAIQQAQNINIISKEYWINLFSIYKAISHLNSSPEVLIENTNIARENNFAVNYIIAEHYVNFKIFYYKSFERSTKAFLEDIEYAYENQVPENFIISLSNFAYNFWLFIDYKRINIKEIAFFRIVKERVSKYQLDKQNYFAVFCILLKGMRTNFSYTRAFPYAKKFLSPLNPDVLLSEEKDFFLGFIS